MTTAEQSAAAPTSVSLLELKDLARTALRPSSSLRDLILSEPDILPEEEVLVRVKVYSRLLYHELQNGPGG